MEQALSLSREVVPTYEGGQGNPPPSSPGLPASGYLGPAPPAPSALSTEGPPRIGRLTDPVVGMLRGHPGGLGEVPGR